MTVKEFFPLVIKNYEDCIEDIKPLYNRDNWWKKIESRNCQYGVCWHVLKQIYLLCGDQISNEHNIRAGLLVSKLFDIPRFSYLCSVPKWNNTKERNIELLEYRISSMKKALELYPDEEI